MAEHFDPLAASDLITTGYRRYLRSLLPVRDPRLARELDEQITHSPVFTKGPLLEATPPYQAGTTPNGLLTEGVLNPAFRALGSQALPLDRRLHKHQEQAIRKVTAGRNVVVASGTGSGKTESFLLPILDALSAEHARGELTPGVRALLLYPMNALANDQLKRLRQLLAHAPHISFGRYVGDTEEEQRKAEDMFRLLNPGETILPNELLSRAMMRQTPPHILLTNYAMLEYLLLRPADIELFEGDYAGHWRFLVLDEAHVYDGARAAEVAMLLRRLRDRVARDTRLQCIATSATVGDDPSAVTSFATKLFGVPFEWAAADPARQDLVKASRIALPVGPFWGPLAPGGYATIASAHDPAAKLLALSGATGSTGNGAAALVFAKERRMARLRELLADGPRPAAQLAAELFGDTELRAEERRRNLDALVLAGGRIIGPDGLPVLSARYHLFVRAADGAYTCLSASGPHVSMGRRDRCDRCPAHAFEFGACRRCGALYLSGTLRTEGRLQTLGLRTAKEDRRTWLLVDDRPAVTDEDDETLETDVRSLDAQDAMLCASCGSLSDGTGGTCPRANCDDPRPVRVRRLKTARDTLGGCLACGAMGPSMVRGLDSGADAAVSVLATALYQALPPADVAEQADQPGEGRKLLLFSDGRQAAAFFAPYLQTSYGTIQHRRLIVQGLERATAHGEVRVPDLVHYVAQAAADAHVFEHHMSAQARERAAALWVMAELTAIDDRQSLEGQGLLRIRLARPANQPLPSVLTSLGLDPEESWSLLAELVRTVRQQGALTMPDGVDPKDEAFDPRRGPIYVRGDGSDPKRKVISWVPTRGNRRLDYLSRLLAVLGSQADPVQVLEECWAQLPNDWCAATTVQRLGAVRQVDHRFVTLDAPSSADPVWRCEQCRRVAPVSVRGICPALRCDGKLVPSIAEEDGHYRHLYQTIRPVPMVVREHTAQLTSSYAADIQQQFVRGQVNALSCSTTFELGVDVGELQTVMLRNMPPTTANYVQRAGRAGRRTESAALAVTYAQRRSHDLSKYADPETMIAGKVRAPYVPLGNERIDRRHAHSVALAAFFRQVKLETGEQWHKAGQFLVGDAPPVARVQPYLTPVPAELTDALRRVLPEEVRRRIGVDTGEWVVRLCELLEDVRFELASEVKLFTERMDEAAASKSYRLADVYQRTINTLTRRPLIGLLANRNVLPKYGFPTDTVELRTSHTGDAEGARVELSRDLSSAIYEYAPGSEVVAGGRLWTSGGVYRLPKRELISSPYAACGRCGKYQEGDELEPACTGCGADRGRATYVIPEFGFVAEPATRAPGLTAPKRSWHGATYVLSPGAEVRTLPWPLAGGGSVVTTAGERGTLVAISDGPGGSGYFLCDWCGWGTPRAACAGNKSPKSHQDPLRARDCIGTTRLRSLAHKYETDLLEVDFGGYPAGAWNYGQWRSVLYALLEGASDLLEISRDDIDGTLYPGSNGEMVLVIFDTVPGGAGGASRIGDEFGEVLTSAHRRVAHCECGEETSCYGCLRNFRNQTFHDDLRRGDAMRFLAPLMGV